MAFPLLGAVIGAGSGGLKSLIEGILHKNAVRKAAKANMFAYGGRPGVEYPGAPPSIMGNILSGAMSGAAMQQSADAVGGGSQWASMGERAPASLAVDTNVIPDTLDIEAILNRTKNRWGL